MQMGPPLQSQDALPPAQETDTSPLQLGHSLLQAGSVDALRGAGPTFPGAECSALWSLSCCVWGIESETQEEPDGRG